MMYVLVVFVVLLAMAIGLYGLAMDRYIENSFREMQESIEVGERTRKEMAATGEGDKWLSKFSELKEEGFWISYSEVGSSFIDPYKENLKCFDSFNELKKWSDSNFKGTVFNTKSYWSEENFFGLDNEYKENKRSFYDIKILSDYTWADKHRIGAIKCSYLDTEKGDIEKGIVGEINRSLSKKDFQEMAEFLWSFPVITERKHSVGQKDF